MKFRIANRSLRFQLQELSAINEYCEHNHFIESIKLINNWKVKQFNMISFLKSATRGATLAIYDIEYISLYH